MSDINSVKNLIEGKVKALGTIAANSLISSLFPREFECYMVAFELCNGKGQTLDYFTFPVMPDELSIEEPSLTKVQATIGGVSSIGSTTFNPKQIHLYGNFGRNLKIIYRGLDIQTSFWSKNVVERGYGFSEENTYTELSKNVKTGFGCLKVLQSIINLSQGVDENGEPNRLYFYNMSFGESYLVKVENFVSRQNIQTNGIWGYDLQMKAVVPLHLDKYKKNKQSTSYVTSAIISGINSVAKDILK